MHSPCLKNDEPLLRISARGALLDLEHRVELRLKRFLGPPRWYPPPSSRCNHPRWSASSPSWSRLVSTSNYPKSRPPLSQGSGVRCRTGTRGKRRALKKHGSGGGACVRGIDGLEERWARSGALWVQKENFPFWRVVMKIGSLGSRSWKLKLLKLARNRFIKNLFTWMRVELKTQECNHANIR